MALLRSRPPMVKLSRPISSQLPRGSGGGARSRLPLPGVSILPCWLQSRQLEALGFAAWSPCSAGDARLWLVETRPLVPAGPPARRPPGSEGVWSHWGPGLGGLVVVGLEGPLAAAQLHGTVGVGEEVGEARREVAHEAVGKGA